MATPAVDKGVQFVPAEYSIFWQSWPQFENANGEHRQVGIELELIGAHASDLNHIDPSCPVCRRVRSVLLEIANRVLTGAVLTQDILSHMVDAHLNSILCLPALGNRSAVSVSVYIYWNASYGQSSDTDLLTAIKTYLDKWGIHQR
ncbi:MAG: hypothetical protein ACM34E_08710 [Acidobacteriota bacterium]